MMVRFIFGCAFFLALSVMAVPIYYGVASNKESLATSANVVEAEGTLTFDEIYDVAADTQEMDPAALNAIVPAAGADETEMFPSGFEKKQDPALADSPVKTAEEKNTDL
jgi:hypothetical protein